MAALHVTAVSDLLGKTIVLTESIHGVQVERRGRVTAYVATAPGSCCDPEFLLEQDDGDVVFYALPEVELHAIE